MAESLQRYGTGVGIPLGAGIGATAAVLSGTSTELGVVVGFGVSGGLVVGGVAGQFADSTRHHRNWAYRVVAVTLLVSLLVGGLLGALAAWTADDASTTGFLVGSAAGGAFGLLLSWALVAAARKRKRGEPTPSRQLQH